jgi:hypothetical protein
MLPSSDQSELGITFSRSVNGEACYEVILRRISNCPNLGKDAILGTYRYLRFFGAVYVGNSLRPAPLADLPYTGASNQQSYPQLLWKSLLRLLKIINFFGG